ncbi:MAG: nitrite/sulfite reductase [Rhodospirillaceae bacterium]
MSGLYRYDELDRRFLAERVEQFRRQVERRLAGELTEEEFRPLRLMNGLYLQLHAYMLRIAVPYGVLSSAQMRALAAIGRRHDRGYGHFTTRQNLQFNWIKLVDVPEILGALAAVDMHAIQTSGNCIRNVTTDQFAGAAPDEAVDPRVYGEILRQWSTLHPEFTFLPRKFKIAITGSPHDRAALAIHDVALRAKAGADGAVCFEVYVGGGLGRSPFLAKLLNDQVAEQDIIAYLEAVLRIYNQYGRRDNIYKARIKILVHEVGVDKLREQIEAEFDRIRGPKFRLDPEIVETIRAHFAPPPFDTLPAESVAFEQARTADPEFARWCRSNLAPHRQTGYAGVTITLKPTGGIPGDITSEQMEAVADLADRFSFGEVRPSHEQNLIFAHVRKNDLHALWIELRRHDLATANAGLIGDIIACPGLDYCALANARSIPLAQQISERFADLDRQHDIGELKIKMSGCINACGHHHVGHIGILGVDKQGVENYQITIGGDATETAALGQVLGPAVKYDEVTDTVEKLVEFYLEQRRAGERFIDTVARIGVRPFKERVYGSAA